MLTMAQHGNDHAVDCGAHLGLGEDEPAKTILCVMHSGGARTPPP